MKVRLERTTRLPRWPWWAIVVVGAWIALAVTAVTLQYATGDDTSLCGFKRLTGVPCPTCGLARGLLALLDGHPVRAWTYNPLLFSVLGILAGALAFRAACGRTIRVRLTRAQRVAAWTAGIGALAANWAYLIVWVG